MPVRHALVWLMVIPVVAFAVFRATVWAVAPRTQDPGVATAVALVLTALVVPLLLTLVALRVVRRGSAHAGRLR